MKRCDCGVLVAGGVAACPRCGAPTSLAPPPRAPIETGSASASPGSGRLGLRGPASPHASSERNLPVGTEAATGSRLGGTGAALPRPWPIAIMVCGSLLLVGAVAMAFGWVGAGIDGTAVRSIDKGAADRTIGDRSPASSSGKSPADRTLGPEKTQGTVPPSNALPGVSETSSSTVTTKPAPTQADLILRGDGIGPFRVGDDADATLQGLVSILGAPTHVQGWAVLCEPAGDLLEQYVTWGTLVIRFEQDRETGRRSMRGWKVTGPEEGYRTQAGIGVGSMLFSAQEQYQMEWPTYNELFEDWWGTMTLDGIDIWTTSDLDQGSNPITSLALNFYPCE